MIQINTKRNIYCFISEICKIISLEPDLHRFFFVDLIRLACALIVFVVHYSRRFTHMFYLIIHFLVSPKNRTRENVPMNASKPTKKKTVSILRRRTVLRLCMLIQRQMNRYTKLSTSYRNVKRKFCVFADNLSAVK